MDRSGNKSQRTQEQRGTLQYQSPNKPTESDADDSLLDAEDLNFDLQN